jgi:hypothetical protein
VKVAVRPSAPRVTDPSIPLVPARREKEVAVRLAGAIASENWTVTAAVFATLRLAFAGVTVATVGAVASPGGPCGSSPPQLPAVMTMATRLRAGRYLATFRNAGRNVPSNGERG